MASDAVSLERKSRIVGYKLTTANFAETSPNLPQRIAVLAEANTANQGTLNTTPKQITSAKQAGDLYGFGSPIYHILRILIPKQGGGVGGVPIFVYPQEEAVGATEKILEITPAGVATGNGTHTIVLAGRSGQDGQFYDINIQSGDTTADITAKIADTLNAVLGAPCIASDTDYVASLSTKWKGLTANDVSVRVDTNDNDLGITYAVDVIQAGSGTPSIADALAAFGENWNTIVVNSYGTVSSIMTALEEFNGKPDPVNPTGRYAGIIMKPFQALTGSVSDDPSAITDARKEEVTIAICPAPGSEGLPMEAAANMAEQFAIISQNTPHLDVAGKKYRDMPTPETIGSMADYNNRDAFVKKGCSTVSLSSGSYVIEDFVTTYHPDGEDPAQFAYCRNIMLDLNIRYGYYLLEQINVVDHALAADSDIVSVSKVVKPKQWKLILTEYAEDLAKRGLIVEPAFMQSSIVVNIGTTNPNRLESFFRYKRSGFVRISSTTAEAGFNFGVLQ